MKASFWIGLGLGALSGVALVTGGGKIKEIAQDIKEKAEDKMNDLHTL